MDKLGHLALFCAEALIIVALFWACGKALRPNALNVMNDTNKSVTLLNCQYSLGGSSAVTLQPGHETKLHAVNACQVHAPAYVGCLSFSQELFASKASVRVSRMNSFVSAEACARTGARESPKVEQVGRN